MIGGPWYEWLGYLALCLGLIAVAHWRFKVYTSFYSVVVIPSATFTIVLIVEVILKGWHKFMFAPLIWFCISMGLSWIYFLLVNRRR